MFPIKKIVCYGDSNTYGYDASDVLGGRLSADARWPELLGSFLKCECVNRGLNGRRVPRYPRTIDADLRILIRDHDCDLILILLGTNDILNDADPSDVADYMSRFIQNLQALLHGSTIVLCAPPPAAVDGLDLTTEFFSLSEQYSLIGEKLGIPFIDTYDWNIPMSSDGIHFSPLGHRIFALKLGQMLRTLSII